MMAPLVKKLIKIRVKMSLSFSFKYKSSMTFRQAFHILVSIINVYQFQVAIN